MSYFDAVILGLLQGFTEFLPVSSSGHLVLAQKLLGIKEAGVSFEVLVHLGSLLAVLIYFRHKLEPLARSLFNPRMVHERKIVLFLFLGTLPAVIGVLIFKDFIRKAFSNPILAACLLFFTGAILLATHFVKKGNKKISLPAIIIMGIAQAFAILPGVSRSATTISAGMFAGVEPSEAAEISFFLSIPAIIGAFVFNLNDLMLIDPNLVGHYLVGTIITFFTSLLAVYAVLTVIKKGKFVYFAYYCFAAGTLGLYLFL